MTEKEIKAISAYHKKNNLHHEKMGKLYVQLDKVQAKMAKQRNVGRQLDTEYIVKIRDLETKQEIENYKASMSIDKG